MDRDVLPDQLATSSCTCPHLLRIPPCLPRHRLCISNRSVTTSSSLSSSPPPFSPPSLIYTSLAGGRRLGEEPQLPGEEGDAQRRQDQPKVTKIVPRIQHSPVTPSWCSFYCHIYVQRPTNAASETPPLTPTAHSHRCTHTRRHTHTILSSLLPVPQHCPASPPSEATAITWSPGSRRMLTC